MASELPKFLGISRIFDEKSLLYFAFSFPGGPLAGQKAGLPPRDPPRAPGVRGGITLRGPRGPRAGWLWGWAPGWLSAGFRLDSVWAGFGLGFRLDFGFWFPSTGILAGFGLGFRFDVGFSLSFTWILVGFEWIWFDFGWIWLGFGWIWVGFCTFACFYYDFLYILASHRLS